MTNGERLKELRITLGVNQSEFAGSLGVVPSFISGIEGGAKDVSRELLQKILEKFGANINWILSGKGEMFIGDKVKEGVICPQKSPLMAELEKTVDDRIKESEDILFLKARLMAIERALGVGVLNTD